MTLANTITALQSIVGDLSAIRQATEAPPEKLVAFPQAVAYPVSGRVIYDYGGELISYHTIALEMHTARKLLDRDYARMIPLIEALPKALYTNPDLDGNILRFNGNITYSFGRLDWVGDVETYGWRFLIPVKQSQLLTVDTSSVTMVEDQTLLDAVTQIQTIVGALDGITQAPLKPLEKIGQFPFATTYPMSGELKNKSRGWFNSVHTVATEFHVARKMLDRDYTKAIPFVERIPAALYRNVNLAGQAETIVDEISYTFGALDWVGDVKTLGWRFITRLKLKSQT